MAVFKCKMCGGSLDISEGVSVATCEYCGTKQTTPKSRDEIVSNLFNRANNLRLKCEFDKAEQVYEKILDIYNNEPEAHWGIVLCKYGIEYVEDPKTYSRIPTCHRTLYEAVLTDVDYLSAIENADEEQKEIYIVEAKVIDELQRNILNIVNSEEPFDVFICYKETDENGKRTIDSAITNDMYYQLTQEGFKVFYAPITLEDKLGYEYEPYIFAALNSAKVMLVVGTKPEYFDSAWVRNEWSRFIKLTKTDRSKLLIPCYKDMDVYELPDEFAHLQAQDMGKIGFITDVIRGLKKVFDRDVQSQQPLKRNKVKKQSKIKPIIEKWKQKRKERSKYCLKFPIHTVSAVYFAICVFLSIYFLCIEPDILTDMDSYFSSIFILFGSIVPFLVFLRFIKNKITAIVLQSFVLFLSVIWYLSDISNRSFNVLLMGLFAIIAQALWLVLVCFSKKTEKLTVKKTNKKLISILAVSVSAALILILELGGFTFLNYQYAKMFYNIGNYETANKYFIYMNAYKDSENLANDSLYNYAQSLFDKGDYKTASEHFVSLNEYKDSEVLVNKAKLLELKNAKIMDKVTLGYYNYVDDIFAGTADENRGWHVIAKEDTKILLLCSCNVGRNAKTTIIGGWKNSTLRKFLNGEYYDTAFNEEIKSRIISTTLKIPANNNDTTTDKIFILSKAEIEKYLPYESQRDTVLYCSTLRDVNGNVYTYLDSFGMFFEREYTYNLSALGDGYRRKSAELINKHIETLGGAPAMWIDISGIE